MNLFPSEILGICHKGTGHHLCRGGGMEGKKEGGFKAISDWLEGRLNFFIKKFRGVNSLITGHILRGVHWRGPSENHWSYSLKKELLLGNFSGLYSPVSFIIIS